MNKNINNLIGNTPIIKIKAKYKENIVNVYAKLEYYNYTGSIKDRLALYIIKDAKTKGLLKDNMPIIEATSGNTGISLAALGAYYNHPVYIFMPNTASIERIKLMKLYGANVYLVSNGFKEAIEKANILAKKLSGFKSDQFNNIKNVETHYNTTGLEIINQVKKIDSFVSGIGTGGTLVGIAKRIKEKHKKVKIIALEPDELPILTKGITKGKHRIEGIGDDFIPKIVDKSIIDKIITIKDEDAINTSKILAKKFGLGVGISSGANLLASIITANNNDNVVTIFPDDSKKYLSTDLTKDINNKQSLVSNQIEIISIENINN